jgi:ubiquinone biosynthesis protein COQ4
MACHRQRARRSGCTAKLREGTLGRTYSEFLRSRNLTPEVFAAPREVRDEAARYVAQRIRQTHDLWHVLTGYDTDVLGEAELQAFTYAQLRTPFSLLVALFGASNANLLSPRVWAAYRRGKRAAPLVWRAWERHFATPLPELRQLLRLTGSSPPRRRNGTLRRCSSSRRCRPVQCTAACCTRLLH